MKHWVRKVSSAASDLRRARDAPRPICAALYTPALSINRHRLKTRNLLNLRKVRGSRLSRMYEREEGADHMRETVPASEFTRNFSRYRVQAQREPVAVSSHAQVIGYFVGPDD